jgi:hypothetical protein
MQNDLGHLEQFGVLAVGVKKVVLGHAHLNLWCSTTLFKPPKLK